MQLEENNSSEYLYNKTHIHNKNDLHYHKDWNWLIPAISKLNQEMKSSLAKTNLFNEVSSMILVGKIKWAYQYFIEALKIHNQQNNLKQ